MRWHRGLMVRDGAAAPHHEERPSNRPYLAGAAALPPVGTAASAVLVDFAPGAAGSLSVLTKRSCFGFAGSVATGIIEPRDFGSTSATSSVVTRLVSRNSSSVSSCRSSHGGTLSDRD